MTKVFSQESLTVYDSVSRTAGEFERAGLEFGHGTDNAWDEAVWLHLAVLGQSWEVLENAAETTLAGEELQSITALAAARIESRKPLAYLLGEAWFAGERYFVSEATLVPRSPIAELILEKFEPWLSAYPMRILDLCTGSGCIGIACAKAFAEARVDLVDISPAALEIASKNIDRHDLAQRVTIIESDGFQALEGRRYDLIVTNPPYVGEAEYAELAPEYKREPKLGLTSGEHGFDFANMLLQEIADYLNPGGLMMVEVGHGWRKFEELHPAMPFLWPAFSLGGEGVFILSREQLLESSSH